MNDTEKCQKAHRLLREWLDQQGHNRCWYYPNIFQKLVQLFEVEPVKKPSLPPLAEFKAGCERYQKEEFGL